MNIATANAIPLSEILKKIGYEPSKIKGNDLWYHSPFRDEKTASFHVNPVKNVWHDFGEGIGGSAIGFVCIYLKRQNRMHTVSHALQWLSEHAPEIIPIPKPRQQSIPPVLFFKLQRVSSLHTKYLFDYVRERGITASIAKKYLREIDFLHYASNRTFKALGLRNDDGGFELRNRAFKGSINAKDMTFIRGSETSGQIIHVFEGMFDHLSALLYQENKQFKDDVIILNSLSNIGRAFLYIRNYSYVEIHTWLDNDHAGEKATQAFKELASEIGIKHQPKNKIYAPHKDVNAWHLARLNP